MGPIVAKNASTKRNRPELYLKCCRPQRPVSQSTGTSAHHQDVFATPILKNLWLGDVDDAQAEEKLSRHGIKRLLNLAVECEYNLAPGIHRMDIPVNDRSDFPIETSIPAAFAYISEALKNDESVLVHCHRGISRSPAIVIGYLIWAYHWTFDEAFAFVKAKRDMVNPNLGFVIALEQLDIECRGSSGVCGTAANASAASPLPPATISSIPADYHANYELSEPHHHHPPSALEPVACF